MRRLLSILVLCLLPILSDAQNHWIGELKTSGLYKSERSTIDSFMSHDYGLSFAFEHTLPSKVIIGYGLGIQKETVYYRLIPRWVCDWDLFIPSFIRAGYAISQKTKVVSDLGYSISCLNSFYPADYTNYVFFDCLVEFKLSEHIQFATGLNLALKPFYEGKYLAAPLEFRLGYLF